MTRTPSSSRRVRSCSRSGDAPVMPPTRNRAGFGVTMRAGRYPKGTNRGYLDSRTPLCSTFASSVEHAESRSRVVPVMPIDVADLGKTRSEA
jgi:hypothetical protein